MTAEGSPFIFVKQHEVFCLFVVECPTKTKDQGILEIEIKDFLSRNFGQGIQGNQGTRFI